MPKKDPELIDYELSKTVFQFGKYKGKTYEEVRENHPHYFAYLMCEPMGKVYRYCEFVKYCLDYMALENIWDEDWIKELKK